MPTNRGAAKQLWTRRPASTAPFALDVPADEAALAVYREVGIQLVLIEAPDKGRDEVLRALDKAAPLVRAMACRTAGRLVSKVP